MILLDTCFLVSFLVTTEKDHEQAIKISKQFHNDELVITNIVLTETINLLTKKMNRNTKIISKIYKGIKNRFKIIYADEELTERSMQTVVKYKAKLGLADAINIEVMKDLNIYEIVSFDPDFDNKKNMTRVY